MTVQGSARVGPRFRGVVTATADDFLLLTEAHGVVGALCDGEDVWRDLVPALEAVDADGALRVDGEALVRVDGDTEQARVGLEMNQEDILHMHT